MKDQITQEEIAETIKAQNGLIAEIRRVIEKIDKVLKPDYKEELLTRQETAQMLSMSLVTLGKYTKLGILPSYRIGSKIRYKKKDVLQALQKTNKFQ